MGQAENAYISFEVGRWNAHRVLWAILHLLTLTAILRGFETEVCTGRMFFLS